MKKQILTLLFLAASCQLMAQRKGKTSVQPAEQTTTLHEQVYRQAFQYHDAATAISSLYYIIEEQGINSTFKDSLAVLYFNVGMYAQCELVCFDLDNTNSSVMQMIAYSQKALGKTMAAIESFQTLSAKTQNKLHAYELAGLQLMAQRYLEFDNTLAASKDWEQGKDSKVFIRTDAQKGQQVPLEAAFLHLKALKEANQKNYENSVQIYEQALSLFPEFELAKKNMVAIRKQMEE